ncbi:putative gustatory receptor 47b [Drosophila grimshawi]|uniref:putative gustatory receptor 47b n=1 Tax=Drosophila grimshawi TaxID=7222 RepID=UPI000C87080D|nr:putative gustatory receptor 47b [Drosophila grimshawi]
MQSLRTDGFVDCYDSMYRLLFYGGGTTFRLGDGGTKSTLQRVIYAFGVRFCLLFGFLAGIYVKLTDPQMSQAMFSHLSPLVKIIFTWECISCIITYVSYCISMDSHRSRHIKLLISMQLLDTEISAKFAHVRWRYNRSRSKYLYGTFGIPCAYVLISLALMFDTTRCDCGYVSTVLIASTYSLITSTIGGVGFIHIALMDYLRIRFRLIIKLVGQQYQAAEKTAGVDSIELQRNMDKLFQFSKRCSQLLNDLNDVFGFVAAAGIFYDFTHMTCFVYMLCQKMLVHEPWDTQYAFLSLHMVTYFYKLLITSIYGYLLQREKRNCLRLLSNYAAHFGNVASARDQVECFQYWRMHNKHIATIGKSVPINISLIYLFVNALANYVIVLVQVLFQLQAKDIHQGHTIPVPKDVELIK